MRFQGKGLTYHKLITTRGQRMVVLMFPLIIYRQYHYSITEVNLSDSWYPDSPFSARSQNYSLHHQEKHSDHSSDMCLSDNHFLPLSSTLRHYLDTKYLFKPQDTIYHCKITSNQYQKWRCIDLRTKIIMDVCTIRWK